MYNYFIKQDLRTKIVDKLKLGICRIVHKGAKYKGWAGRRETRTVRAWKLSSGLVTVQGLAGRRGAGARVVCRGLCNRAVILRDATRLQRLSREQPGV